MAELGIFLAVPTITHLMWAGAAVIGLFGLAVVLDVFRRRREDRMRVEADWERVREIADEKGLSDDARRELFDLIRRFAPKTPLQVLTVRREFDRCVDEDLASRAANTADYEARGAFLRDIRAHLGLDHVPYGQRIFSTRELQRGQPVWIAHGTGGALRWHRMKVAGVDEAQFRLTPHAGHDVPVPAPDTMLQCRVWRDEDARYRFSARFLRRESDPPEWVFEHATELIRLQSRAHYRIRIHQVEDIAVLNAPVDGDYSDLDKREAVTRFRGQITSLSGGGFAAVLPQPVPKQVLLRTKIRLGPGVDPVLVTARIVETTPISADRHLVRAAFVGLPEDDQERITHYVMQHQPTLRHEDNDHPVHTA